MKTINKRKIIVLKRQMRFIGLFYLLLDYKIKVSKTLSRKRRNEKLNELMLGSHD